MTAPSNAPTTRGEVAAELHQLLLDDWSHDGQLDDDGTLPGSAADHCQTLYAWLTAHGAVIA